MRDLGLQMAKRDYYEILGVSKSSAADEIKNLIAKLRFSFTRTGTPEIRKRKKNSKRLQRHMMY